MSAYVHDGLICDSTVEIRRIVFYNYYPSYFTGNTMKILKVDDSIIGGMDNATLTAYYQNP